MNLDFLSIDLFLSLILIMAGMVLRTETFAPVLYFH